MFVIWGKKTVYRKIGYVADFCPICRAKRAFELKRVGSASHVYYISAGEGTLVGFERTCLECHVSVQADPNAYASVSKTNEPLDTLARLTFPAYNEKLQERLALEARLQNEPLSFSAADRHALIRNPFLLLSPKVEKRFASTHIDWQVALSIVAAIALLILVPAAAHAVLPGSEANVMLVAAGIGIALIAWQGMRSGRRFMRREVLPALAKALRPLQPTESEIQAVVTELKQLRHKIGRKVVLADLRSTLELRAG